MRRFPDGAWATGLAILCAVMAGSCGCESGPGGPAGPRPRLSKEHEAELLKAVAAVAKAVAGCVTLTEGAHQPVLANPRQKALVAGRKDVPIGDAVYEIRVYYRTEKP
jgi:hypothetical protein